MADFEGILARHSQSPYPRGQTFFVFSWLSSAEAIGIGLHESYMKFRLGSGTRAGGDGKTEERIASAS